MNNNCDDKTPRCAGPGFCRQCTREYDDGVRDDPRPPSADELERRKVEALEAIAKALETLASVVEPSRKHRGATVKPYVRTDT